MGGSEPPVVFFSASQLKGE